MTCVCMVLKERLSGCKSLGVSKGLSGKLVFKRRPEG